MVSSTAVMNTYGERTLSLSHGEGVWLYAEDGRRYLDCLAGIAVSTLGHAHPVLTTALREQVGQLIHCSNLYDIPLQRRLAEMLVERSGMDNAFFCNSGLEANEAALKIARLAGHNRGIESPEIVVYENAFHGRSIATLSATASAKVQKGFEPLVPGFVRTKLNDIDDLRRIADTHPNVCAVFLETIQGEGGIHQTRADYLRDVRQLCDERGWLMMLDEVQCGTGRTGRWYAYQWADIVPDVVPFAKGLASGVPVGGVLARGVAAQTFQPGNHGTTFGGNPLAMRAAITTIEVVEADDLLGNAAAVGEKILSALRTEIGGLDGATEIRGQGLMIGIEMAAPCTEFVAKAMEARMLLNVTAGNVIRLLPPLIFTQEHADWMLERLIPLLRQQAQSNP